MSAGSLSEHELTSAALSPAPEDDIINATELIEMMHDALPESFHDDVTACCERTPIDSVFCLVPEKNISFTMLSKIFHDASD